jgi:hypothetical protein
MLLLPILIVLGIFFVIECVLMEVEHWGWATFTLLASFGLSLVAHHFWPDVPSVLSWVAANGVFTLVYVLAYLAVGVGWSFIKWFSYLMGFRDSFREQKEAFCTKNGLDPKQPIPEDRLAQFDQHLSSNVSWGERHRGQLLSRERPRAAKSKARITAWMAFWPFSVVGTVLNDPVRRLFNFLFTNFKALYQKMADHVFRKDVELK